MTREGDYDLADEGRQDQQAQDGGSAEAGQFVKDKHADLSVSIHMNSIPSPKWSGAQTFFYPNQPDNADFGVADPG